MADDTEVAESGRGGGSDTYSPLLARMLRIDPNAVDTVSLSALGRTALGADTEDYRQAKEEVDQARAAMVEALQARRSGVDPSMLALASGFLAPTRTGSFGESLGSAVKGYGEAQRQQSQEAAELAKMRYELARGAMQERAAEAKLGLDVASKLTPQLTDLQKQVRAEGLDPSSAEGKARIRELQALKTATPEMREFAARAGVSISDPKFSDLFKQEAKIKPLKEIALRENLDLNDPAQFAKATDIMRSEKLRAAKPEITKMLETFGGDVLKPEDVARAERMLSAKTRREMQPEIAKMLDTFGGSFDKPEDVRKAEKMLADRESQERQQREAAIASSRASTEASRLQAERTRQEIAEGKRSNMPNVVPQAAAAAGVPLANVNRYAGMTPKEEIAAREKDKKTAEAYIEKNVTPFMGTVDGDITNLKRALQLNSQISTGVTYGLPLGIGETAKALSGDRALINEFDSLAALAAKQNRIPGDSNVSNLDVKMMQLGTFSSDKEPSANKVIIEYQLAQRERDRDFNSYLMNYAAVNGVIDSNASVQWRRYLDANPITSRDAKGRIAINKDRMSYQEFFNAPRVKVDAKGREQRGQ